MYSFHIVVMHAKVETSSEQLEARVTYRISQIKESEDFGFFYLPHTNIRAPCEIDHNIVF